MTSPVPGTEHPEHRAPGPGVGLQSGPQRWGGWLDARRCAPWLWLLTGLFALRVAAQPAALVASAAWLPPFDSWHGGVLPYPVLLLSQVAILGWLGWTARQFGAGAIAPSRPMGYAAVAFGTVYFGVMLIRLLLGVTVLADVRWFASPLPAFFHLVLATYVLLFGLVHLDAAASPSAHSTESGAPRMRVMR
jgi:hypothetical protein